MPVTGFYCEKSGFPAQRKLIGNESAVLSSLALCVPIPLHMLRHDKSAPIWLFSFVDLAFLLLIAFTQIAPDRSQAPADLAELEIPQIYGRGTPLANKSSAGVWQLRVHPSSLSGEQIDARTPFELVEPGRAPIAPAIRAIDADELASQLRILHSRASNKPVLAPHPDSRSEDLLVAISMLEDVWKNARTVAVRPGLDVAAGPSNDDAR